MYLRGVNDLSPCCNLIQKLWTLLFFMEMESCRQEEIGEKEEPKHSLQAWNFQHKRYRFYEMYVFICSIHW